MSSVADDPVVRRETAVSHRAAGSQGFRANYSPNPLLWEGGKLRGIQ